MNYAALAGLPFLAPLGIFAYPLIALVLVWTIVIKGIALWKSARNGDKIWFIVMLIVNALGIPELVYLIWFSKKRDAAPATVSTGPVTE